VKIRYV